MARPVLPRWGRGSRKAGLTAAVCALLAAGVGCGESEGIAAGATVTAYVAAPLCAEAKRELAREGGGVGDVRVRVLCLAPVERGKRLSLAAVGANARRATEDSTAIAYLEVPGPASRFAQPIVEEAGIAWTASSSGATAIRRVFDAIAAAGSGSLRDSVREALE